MQHRDIVVIMMDANTKFKGEQCGYLRIDASPLQAEIYGGNEVVASREVIVSSLNFYFDFFLFPGPNY